MKIRRIRGDGNCLFRGCGYHLGLHHSEVRRKTVRAIRRNLKINGTPVSDWISGISLEDYTREMIKDRTYGTGIELSVISLIFKRTISIWVLVRTRIAVVSSRAEPEKTQPNAWERREGRFKRIAKYNPVFGKTINLLFSGSPESGHYDILLRS